MLHGDPTLTPLNCPLWKKRLIAQQEIPRYMWHLVFNNSPDLYHTCSKDDAFVWVCWIRLGHSPIFVSEIHWPSQTVPAERRQSCPLYGCQMTTTIYGYHSTTIYGCHMTTTIYGYNSTTIYGLHMTTTIYGYHLTTIYGCHMTTTINYMTVTWRYHSVSVPWYKYQDSVWSEGDDDCINNAPLTVTVAGEVECLEQLCGGHLS